MQLSMAIVEHWLQKYEPVSTISSQKPTIMGIRLFNYEKTPDPNYLYVGKNHDFFQNSTSDEVLLVHRKDVISLKTYELEDVFDSLMDAFVFYQSWEQKMFSAFQQPNPEQVIIDACESIFGPIFFTNMRLQITAFSKNYPPGSINRNWDDFWNLGTLSLESLSLLQNGPYLEKLTKIWNCEAYYDNQVDRYPYAMMISQVNSHNQLTGQLCIISETPFSEYQFHLAAVLKRTLCLVADRESGSDSGSVASNLFLELLQNPKKDVSSINVLYFLQNWKPDWLYMVCILKKAPGNTAILAFYLNHLRKLIPNGIFIMNPENEQDSEEILCALPADISAEIPSIIALLHKESAGNLLKFFFQTCQRLQLDMYFSYPFQGISNLSYQYQQAHITCRQNRTFFYDCALDTLISFDAAANFRSFALHPTLMTIRTYDRENHTNFYEMLRVYLRCERNCAVTAQQLFIHKNTLAYRLEKMKRLFHLNLDQFYEREYLLVSYRYLDRKQDR